MPPSRQIFAFSGVLTREPGERGSSVLVDFAIELGRRSERVRLTYLATALGDSREAIEFHSDRFADRDDVEFSVLKLFPQPNVAGMREHLLAQDVILVEGGSVVNLVAVWTAHGLPQILRDCWQAGVVLAGPSAGSLCWHTGGPTDSFRDELDPFTNGLGFLPFSNGVHDDFDAQPRRDTYRAMVAQGVLPAGYATEDGVGLHYLGEQLHEAITMVPGKRAWYVEPDGHDGYLEHAIIPRLI
ncbi:peptidase E [Rhizocola hellebori]|uniref:Peptidase E n=1 Tax=Rhizocola hellebori TaxID=1392758 RepID=A0A8J3Q513_9ACTN|nr:peptidase E [Rhizocola hellebori]GIH03350.1 peptidase E [Rhizocola hellebori]